MQLAAKSNDPSCLRLFDQDSAQGDRFARPDGGLTAKQAGVFSRMWTVHRSLVGCEAAAVIADRERWAR